MEEQATLLKSYLYVLEASCKNTEKVFSKETKSKVIIELLRSLGERKVCCHVNRDNKNVA